ncbi:MAG: YceI family protein [Candidatus Dormibacteraeota bacterium]|nr:YceI family protein [Candidatus Dormibacteraeota bacterium]
MRVPHPRTRLGWTVSAFTGLVVAGAAAFLVVYLTQFGGSNVAPLTLSSGSASPAARPTLTRAQLAGKWTVTSPSVAGYRVREQLAFLQSPSDAVGRTSSVSGSMTVTEGGSGLTVTSAQLSVDVSALTSDQQMRDQHLHTLGLESDQFPTATFVLTTPIVLPATVVSGAQFSVSATGQLTIHGVTKTVTIPLTGRLSAAQVEVAGSISFPFEMFGMQVPNVAGFVSVVDRATMEFDVHFARA